MTQRRAKTSLRGVLGALLVGVLLLAMPGATAARWSPPPEALVQIGASDPWLTPGYGDHSDCFTCKYYPWSTTTSVETFVNGVDSTGRLVTVQNLYDRIEVRRFSLPGTKKVRGIAKAQVLKAPKRWTVGGFHFGEDGNWYLLLGRDNPKEKKGRVTMQVRQYDEALNRLGTAKIKARGPQTHSPFAGGGAAFTMMGDQLLVLMAQTEFAAGDGLHHQAARLLSVDTATMTADYVTRMASHSFAQFIEARDGEFYTAEHGDAYPRAMTVTRFRWDDEDEFWRERYGNALKLQGRTGNNYTGATLNGFALTSTSALTVGVSVPHRHPVKGVTGFNAKMKPNVYVATTDRDTMKSTFRWMTTFHPKRHKKLVGLPRLIMLDDDRSALLFDVATRKGHTTHYRLLDSTGNTIGRATFPGRFTALSQPVLHDNQLLWVGLQRDERFDRGGAHLSALDVTDPLRPVQLTR